MKRLTQAIYINNRLRIFLSLVFFLHLSACAPAQEPAAPAKAPPAAEVKDPPGLKRLTPDGEVWLDVNNKRVVLNGYVCLREGQLEMMVTLAETKEHEAILAIKSKAFIVQAGLLALGAKVGSPVQFRPEYKPPTGTEIEVEIEWTGPDGKTHKARAQDWIRHVRTQQAMTFPFVFAGSGFFVDETNKERVFLAEEGDFICVSNFPSAMLDVPVASSQGNDALMFEAFTERIPPVKTPVKIYLTPKLGKPGDKQPEATPAKTPEK